MTPPNGHTTDAIQHAPAGERVSFPQQLQFSRESLTRIFQELDVPFDTHLIKWRVIATAKNKTRGQVVPYVDSRAYTDRLNRLLSPAGWTREVAVHTSANFQRPKDQKITAKVFVTCKLTLVGINSHTATGEKWADDEHSGTTAESQAFKRACACFGLGRYFYYFRGQWLDLDQGKQPRSLPALPDWATPDGWLRGLRPPQQARPPLDSGKANAIGPSPAPTLARAELLRRIDALKKPLGTGIYRGLLFTLARRFKAVDIKEPALLQKILLHMQGAARGLQRLDKALAITGPEALEPILDFLQLSSLDKVKDLKTLHSVVSAIEAKAGIKRKPA